MNFKQSLLSGKLAERVNEAVFGEEIMDLSTVVNVMRPLISQHTGVECFYVIYLNAKNQVIQIKKEFNGSLSSCAVYPREILKEALRCDCAAMILAHNHPSGNPEPSDGDKEITKNIFIGCKIMEMQLHDHIIIGRSVFSMADSGIISNIKEMTEELTK